MSGHDVHKPTWVQYLGIRLLIIAAFFAACMAMGFLAQILGMAK